MAGSWAAVNLWGCSWPVGEPVTAAGSLTTGGSATDRLKEMTGLGWSVGRPSMLGGTEAASAEEIEGEENAAEGKASG